MGINRDFAGISERLGAGTADFYDKIANGVREFACGLWSQFPDQITQNTSIGSSFARGFMGATCSGIGSPPPTPDPGVIGGQCPETEYAVTVEYNLGEALPPRDRTVIAYGPIRGFDSLFDAAAGRNEAQLYATTAPPDSQPTTIVVDAASASLGEPDISRIVDIVRVDGFPDDCGNLEGGYPISNPQPEDYSDNITINNEDGIDIIFPVTYNPGGDNFPMNFTVNDIDVQLNLGGISFFFGKDRLPDGQPHPLPPPGDKTTISKDPFSEDDFTRVFPKNDDETIPETIEEQEEKEQIEEEELEAQYVLVDVTTLPDKGKTILHANQDDNTFFAGYFSWTIVTPNGVYREAEQPIRKLKNYYRAPLESVGYAAYTVNGAKIKITKYLEKQEDA